MKFLTQKKMSIPAIKNNIHSKKNWRPIIIYSCWLIICGYFEYYAVDMFLNDDISVIGYVFFSVWLIFWSTVGIGVMSILLWLLIGEEIIQIGDNKLFISKKLLWLVVNDQFDIDKIRYLTLNKNIYEWGKNFNFNPFKNGQIEFEYDLKTVKIFTSFNRVRAMELLVSFKQNPQFTNANFN